MANASSGIAVVYYSRSGHSAAIASRLSQELGADLIELKGPAHYDSWLGYLRAGFDSLKQKNNPTPQDLPPLTGFEHVILCGPVWTSFPAVPLRTLMRSVTKLPSAVSLFLTSGGNSPADKAFSAGENDLGRPFVTTASLPNSYQGTADEDRIVQDFLNQLPRTPNAVNQS